jgi:hypothetical protein
MWIPCIVSDIAVFDRKRSGVTGIIKLSDLAWGTQQGIPFPLPDAGLPAVWEVAMPAEDSGLWLDVMMQPAAWATTLADDLKTILALEKLVTTPSPAGFGLLLKDNASVVGEHVR